MGFRDASRSPRGPHQGKRGGKRRRSAPETLQFRPSDERPPRRRDAGTAGGPKRPRRDSWSTEDVHNPLGAPPLAEQLAPPDLVDGVLGWAAPRSAGPGLLNMGNTCFLNSTMQCLAALPPLVQLLEAGGPGLSREGRDNDILGLLRRFLEEYRSVRGNAFGPKTLVNNLRRVSRSFRPGRQEDAHEYLRHLLDGLHRACLERAGLRPTTCGRRAETSAVHRLFGGYLRSQLKCDACGYCSHTYDAFLDLSLEVSGRRGNALNAALAAFQEPETLDRANRWKCGGCKRLVQARKQITLWQAPAVLCIQLKRFSYGSGGGMFGGGKINTFVAYPETLELAVTGGKRKTETVAYALHGVVVHVGQSVHLGHYFAYIKAGNRLWYLKDDSTTTKVPRKEALSQKAYILFYVRVPSPPAMERDAVVEDLEPKLKAKATSAEADAPGGSIRADAARNTDKSGASRVAPEDLFQPVRKAAPLPPASQESTTAELFASGAGSGKTLNASKKKAKLASTPEAPRASGAPPPASLAAGTATAVGGDAGPPGSPAAGNWTSRLFRRLAVQDAANDAAVADVQETQGVGEEGTAPEGLAQWARGVGQPLLDARPTPARERPPTAPTIIDPDPGYVADVEKVELSGKEGGGKTIPKAPLPRGSIPPDPGYVADVEKVELSGPEDADPPLVPPANSEAMDSDSPDLPSTDRSQWAVTFLLRPAVCFTPTHCRWDRLGLSRSMRRTRRQLRFLPKLVPLREIAGAGFGNGPEPEARQPPHLAGPATQGLEMLPDADSGDLGSGEGEGLDLVARLKKDSTVPGGGPALSSPAPPGNGKARNFSDENEKGRGDLRKMLRDQGKAEASVYGMKVDAWEGNGLRERDAHLAEVLASERRDREKRRLDEWDAALDSGKRKKVKAKTADEAGLDFNPFQRRYDESRGDVPAKSSGGFQGKGKKRSREGRKQRRSV